MMEKPMHIVFTIANNSSVPLFNWFAKESIKHADLKFSFVALHHERPVMLDEMQKVGCDCYWIKYRFDKRKRSMIAALFKLIRLFKKLKPDVVTSHLFDDAVPAMLAARICGIKVRAMLKQDTAFHFFYAPKAVWFDKLNNWNATHLIAPSWESHQFILEKEKANPKKLCMIHSGIPIALYTNFDKQDIELIKNRFDLQGKKVIGTVSRLIDWKGYKYIIEAASKIVPLYPEIKFMFVGTGPQEEELRQLVKQKGLENYIVFTGHLERKLTYSIYKVFDIFLHAAFYEPYGYVIAEAMVNECVMLTTPTGAAKDAITHLENGYIVPYKNADAIADGIKYIFENPNNQWGQKAKAKAEELFSFQLMFNNYIYLFNKTLGK